MGSREAITRRFFLVFEHELLPGTKRGQEEAEAIASLQTAARTAANYLRQCGNEVISHENEDEATCEILYNILCRQASNEKPFPQKVKEVLAEYMVAGRPLDTIPSNDFYAPSHIDLTHGRYICLYRRTAIRPRFPPAGCPCWSTPGTGSTWICSSPASPRTG